jgi:hypothetical protein
MRGCLLNGFQLRILAPSPFGTSTADLVFFRIAGKIAPLRFIETKCSAPYREASDQQQHTILQTEYTVRRKTKQVQEQIIFRH